MSDIRFILKKKDKHIFSNYLGQETKNIDNAVSFENTKIANDFLHEISGYVDPPEYEIAEVIQSRRLVVHA